MKKVLLTLLLAPALVLASPPDNRPPDRGTQRTVTQTQEAIAESSSQSAAESVSTSTSTATGGSAQGGAGGAGGEGGAGGAANASASNEGVSVGGDSYRSESNNTNVVLVPNNNTSNCMRVWGISFGTHEGAAGLGLPTRDASCDFEQAADDAAATGNHKIAWWWRCHKKNLWKTFRASSDTDAQARLACFNSMTEMLPMADGNVVIPEEEYQHLLMAQVQKEEFERVQDRITQQESLIESLEKEHSDKEAEIERLKREAAKMKAKQKDAETRDAARRAAALKALEKKKEDE